MSFILKLFPKLLDLYNKCRNFIAKNKSRLKKFKINFENSTLLEGWDVNKEMDNLICYFKKKTKWPVALLPCNNVMNEAHKDLFDYHLNFNDHNEEKNL